MVSLAPAVVAAAAGALAEATETRWIQMRPPAQYLLRAAETLASATAQHIGGGDEIIGDDGAARSEAAALVDEVAAGFTSTVARMGGLSLSTDGSNGGGSHGLSLRVDSLENLATASTQCLIRLTRLIEADDGIAAAKPT